MDTRLSPGQYFGRITTSRTLHDLILSETYYPRTLSIPRHSHEHAYVSVVLRGSYDQTYGRRSRVCRPMSLVFHPPDEEHAARFPDTSVRSFNIEIGSNVLACVREHSTIFDDSAEFQGGAIAALALKLYGEYRRMDDLSSLAIEGLLLSLVADASRRARKSACRVPPPWLERAKEIIHDRFTETLRLSEIATEVAVHPVYLAAQFRRYYRCTVGEYQRGRRIELAARALAASDLPLSRIALDAGFSSQAHFSTVFKRLTGMTPAQYRSVSLQRVERPSSRERRGTGRRLDSLP